MGDITKGLEVTPEAKVETPEKKFVPEEDYKNLQREVSKRETRIRELEAGNSSVIEIRDESAKLREDIAALYDYVATKLTSETGTEAPIKSKQDALRTERETRERERISQSAVAVHQSTITNLLAESGIDKDDSKLELARAYWKAGDVEKSVSEVRRVTGETKASKDTTNIDALVEERVNARVEKALTDAGLKKFPGGQPAGQSANYKELRQKYIDNPYDKEVREKWLKVRNSGK